jgi:hypothetical protein
MSKRPAYPAAEWPRPAPLRTYAASLADDSDARALVAWAESHPDQCPLLPAEVTAQVWARPWRGAPNALLRRVRKLAALAGWLERPLLGAGQRASPAFIPRTSTWTGPPPGVDALTLDEPANGYLTGRDQRRIAAYLASVPGPLLLSDLLAACPIGPPESRAVQTRAGRILAALGWRKVRRRRAPDPHRYLPPGGAPTRLEPPT